MRNFFNSPRLAAILLPLIVVILMVSCTKKENFNGYRIVEKKFVKEVNAECYLLEHLKSGARVLKIASDDPNKTFGIAFRTIPESDEGTPHILEHSVLNGSKNFPVKSPFDILMKGSLNTFINAFTSNDFTCYPVASTNEKDYFNLMHVYLDAVFNPLIYSEPRILMQEGWHYEMTSKDAPLEYKGVVYNEMKGAFSSPETVLYEEILKNLFPETSYRFESGGMPSAIPDLTYEKFLAFHKKYYHPSNSYILLYGNAPLDKELEFIDKEYLSGFDKAEAAGSLETNPPFADEKQVTCNYSVIEGAPVNDQTYLALNWVVGSGADDLLSMKLDLLADVLVNQESGPVRLALMEAGIGKEVTAYSQRYNQNIFSIVAKNANPADKDKFRQIVLDALGKVASDKLDEKALLGTLNRTEFRLREGSDAQKGLMYLFRCINGWIYTGNPFPSLEYETYLAGLKDAAKGNGLLDFIKTSLVENKYRVLLTLEPKPGLEKEIALQTEKKLAEFKKTLTPAQIDSIVDLTNKLIAYQKTEDSPEAIAKMPLLKISDIDPKARWFECKPSELGGVSNLYHNDFTNGIVYSTLWFDLSVLPKEQLPYAAFITELLGKVGTKSYDFKELDKTLNINTGSFSSHIGVRVPAFNDSKTIANLVIDMKTTTDKLDTMFNLAGEILLNTNFLDKDRIGEILNRSQANLESSLNQDGYGPAATRFTSYITKRGMINEITSNIDYYRFLTSLRAQFEKDPDAVLGRIKEVAEAIVGRSNISAGVTCSDDEYQKYSSAFTAFTQSLPDRKLPLQEWEMVPVAANEGIMSSSKVQYVMKGAYYRTMGYEWSGKMEVLRQILSTEYLQTQIRVIGGAYGGFLILTEGGQVTFASYRDPNLPGTLENYDKTTDFLKNFDADSTSMTRFIIGTIAGMDFLTTPEQRGYISFSNYFSKKTPESEQKHRDEVLSVTKEDIRGMSTFIEDVLKQNTICVYGNDELLKKNSKLFRNLITIEK
ncbi:MAG: insulinase family protein [Bacteroidales bacterium]